MINIATQTVTSTIAVGVAPQSVAITPDGKTAYVVLNGANQVQLIDVATAATTGTPIAIAASPNRVAITQDGLHALVTYSGATAGGLTLIDTATQSVTLPVVNTGKGSLGVAVAHHSSTAYVTKGAETGVEVVTLKPSVPTNVTGVPGVKRATVSWQAPTRTGGQPITAYKVTASPGGNTCTTTGATTCTIKKLWGGTNYTFTVTATNTYGISDASAASAAVLTLRPTTRLKVNAVRPRAKLKPRRTREIVRSIQTNGRVRQVKVVCLKDGRRLKGKAKRRACSTSFKRKANNAQAWVTPKCSTNLQVKAKIVVVKGSRLPNKWVRTWDVRPRPRINC